MRFGTPLLHIRTGKQPAILNAAGEAVLRAGCAGTLDEHGACCSFMFDEDLPHAPPAVAVGLMGDRAKSGREGIMPQALGSCCGWHRRHIRTGQMGRPEYPVPMGPIL